jgi:hypothetical protein
MMTARLADGPHTAAIYAQRGGSSGGCRLSYPKDEKGFAIGVREMLIDTSDVPEQQLGGPASEAILFDLSTKKIEGLF